MAGPSWRLKFIDIDESFTISTDTATYKGYMVCRAPKGTTEPLYFEPGNEAVIHAMIGIPTAHWPDLAEAIAYNNEYGLYLSAPAGTSEEYPSYYGGVYITKNGVFPFYEVSDKDEPNWYTAIACGSETTYMPSSDAVASVAVTALSSTNGSVVKQGAFVISGINATLYANLAKFVLDFWGSDYTNCGAKKIECIIGTDAKIYYLTEEGAQSEKYIGTAVRNAADGTYTLQFGEGYAHTGISASDVGCPFFTFDKLVSYNDLYDSNGALTATIEAALKKLIALGGTETIGTKSYQSVSGVMGRVKWIVSVKNDTYQYIVQKSPTEKVTVVTISDIGYDKYRYDQALAYVVDYPLTGGADFLTGNANELFAAIATKNSATILATGIYQKNGNTFTNVTAEYLTQYIRLYGPCEGAAVADETPYTNVLKYVGKNAASKVSLLPVGPDQTYKAEKNTKYNTVSFSITEEVYPGEATSGGTFTGSLDELGTDTYGANIYWPNVLPDNSMSFVEVVPVKSFDDDLDSKGFFSGERIVDLFGPEPDISTSYIQGQRYIAKLVQDNIDAGVVGGTYVDKMFSVVNLGWIESYMPKYDDAYVFMEPTGDENLKAKLLSLRATHQLSTVISPKVITKSEFLAPKTIAVAGRGTGTAQYVGEFFVKDPYTSLKYWCQPIGDVGLNLTRIIDKKMGGWAPMWNNITGNLGGQLSRSVLKAKWDLDDTATQILDSKGLNPIVYNADDGLMIVSQKTTQDPNNTTDWSYLGHSMAFDLLKRNIRDNVMRPQIGKPIDTYWMDIRQKQVDAILDRRITGSQPIWAAATCDIAGVNTDTTKAQRKFCIKVKVKVNVFSEFVELTLVNVAQTTTL